MAFSMSFTLDKPYIHTTTLEDTFTVNESYKHNYYSDHQ